MWYNLQDVKMQIYNFYFEVIEEGFLSNGDKIAVLKQKNIGSFIDKDLGMETLKKQYEGLIIRYYLSEVFDYDNSK